MLSKLTLVSLGVAISAFASAGGSLGTANNFNAFVFGNATVNGGGESEGAVAVGGNFTANSNYNVLIHNNPAVVGSLSKVGMYVAGNATFNNGGQLNNGGNAYVGGSFSTTNPYDFNGGGGLSYGTTVSGTIHGSTTHSNLVDNSIFSAQKIYSLNQSSAIKDSHPTRLSTHRIRTTGRLNLGAAANNKTYVVNLTAAQLGGFNGNPVTLNLGSFNSTDTLLFNVSGSSVSHFGLSLNASGLQNRILWNFADATSINIDNRQFEGTLLAPKATVNQSIVIEGNLIANNWNTMNAPEIHSYNFTGTAPVPEPSSFLGLAIGGLGIVGLRRRVKHAS